MLDPWIEHMRRRRAKNILHILRAKRARTRRALRRNPDLCYLPLSTIVRLAQIVRPFERVTLVPL